MIHGRWAVATTGRRGPSLYRRLHVHHVHAHVHVHVSIYRPRRRLVGVARPPITAYGDSLQPGYLRLQDSPGR